MKSLLFSINISLNASEVWKQLICWKKIDKYIYKRELAKIGLTIPLYTAEVERTFSNIQRIKSSEKNELS